jgi:[acyl-carrier-protein] S-malonyltransferase
LWNKSDYQEPAMVMGHSLGEYTALAAAGALSMKETVALVTRRGRFMQAAPEGAMAAVLGIAREQIEETLGRVGDVWVANINAPGQVVVSGKASAVAEVGSMLKSQGAKVIALKVSVASHCPLMHQASQALAEYLAGVRVSRPASPVVFNASARPEDDPEKIRGLLREQLISPVRWVESVEYAVSQGIDHFVEIGPKSVLAAFIKRIAPQARVETRTCA